jgi:radical SAM/Cys-rich protein
MRNLKSHITKKVEFGAILNANKISNRRENTRVLQLNLGKKCNQSCVHCHVNAGPDKLESMDRNTIDRILKIIAKDKFIHTVDITGGAPEMNPNFIYLVTELAKLNIQIIDRCNLTVLFESGLETIPEFLAQNNVRIIASMPCYMEENVDAQRGDNVYHKSIEALKLLNQLGYGKTDGTRILDLVYNPSSAFLPPEQHQLEADYKDYLKREFGIDFNNLLTITNMPINRFADILEREGEYESYCNLLQKEFNAIAASRIMCKELLSISWDGRIFDCDFNQALDIPLKNVKSIWDINDFNAVEAEISFGNHCFGCTAGSGSSCKGALV